METKIVPLGRRLIVLIGPSGAGKTTFRDRHFESREIVSTDDLRIEFTGELERQDLNDQVFKEFHRRIEAKLEAGQRVVADATHLRTSDRKRTAEIGARLNVPVHYIVINRPVEAKLRTAGWRKDVRINGKSLIEKHEETFVANEQAILSGDGLATMVIDTRVDQYKIVRPLPRDPKLILPFLHERGYEYLRVIADVHGNREGLMKALEGVDDRGVTFFLFLGDLVDYGLHTLETAEIAADLILSGEAAGIRGNHERKVNNFIVQERGDGFRGEITHGNEITFNRLKAMSPADRLAWENKFLAMIGAMPDHIVITDVNGFTYAFAHAAMSRRMLDMRTARFNRNTYEESLALYGETDGTKGPDGYPTRLYNWVDEIPNRTTVVVGHAIRSDKEPMIVRNTDGGKVVFLDTGSGKNTVTELDGTVRNPNGHLSWLDLRLVPKGERGIAIEEIGYGRD